MSTAAFDLADAMATEAVGARLAPNLTPGMLITLAGDLGAGKTTLARGVLRGCGWTGPVKSPTYTLVEIYPISSLYFYHFDFYRFDDSAEWETAGLADYFRADAVCLVEWPERVAGLLPPADLEIVLAHPPDMRKSGRELALRSRTAAGERCVAAITQINDPVLTRSCRFQSSGGGS